MDIVSVSEVKWTKLLWHFIVVILVARRYDARYDARNDAGNDDARRGGAGGAGT